MARVPKHFLITWILTAAVAIVMWLVFPGSPMDRQAFGLLVDAPAELSGTGSHEDPWIVQRREKPGREGSMPASVGLKDNLEGIFQSSPHSAIDLAVIFDNLHRLGTRHLACSVLLAWEEPDPAQLTALEIKLMDFESVVLAAPVTRGPIMETMPPDFQRASLPLDALGGDPSTLPAVNRVSIPKLIWGGEKSMAGFEAIDSEPSAEHMHLMARWDDRVIFAFPVVAAIQYLQLKPEDLIIEVGKHLQLGEAGPAIPIDEFGRMTIDAISVVPETDLLAKELIDAEAGAAGLPDMESALLCDLRSHADITTRDFNRMIPSSIEKLTQGQGRPGEVSYARMSRSIELPILLTLALTLSLAGLWGRGPMSAVCLAAIGGVVLATWLGLQRGLWFPGFEALLVALAALLCGLIAGGKRKRTTSMPRLDRLEFDTTPTKELPDAVDEGQDYALAPKKGDIESGHESD